MQAAARKAEKAAEKAETADRKLPTKTIIQKKRVMEEHSGKVKTRLEFGKVAKEEPISLTRKVANSVPAETVSREVRKYMRENSDGNVGVQSAETAVHSAETSVRSLNRIDHARKLKPYKTAVRAESRVDRANLTALFKVSAEQHTELHSNPYSRWKQKQAIRRAYAEAKRTGSTVVEASSITGKAAAAVRSGAGKVSTLIQRNYKPLLIGAGIALALLVVLGSISSAFMLFQGGGPAVAASTYPSQDVDMLAAESQYLAMETELQTYLDTYESTHSYDEYHYELDTIEHDPYVLMSILTAMQGEWTIDEVQSLLQTLFDKQYILTETVTKEIRTRVVDASYIDDDGVLIEDTDIEEYDYFICSVKFENFNLSHVPVYTMSQTQLSMYAMYMSTLGNRPDLFPTSSYISRYDGNYFIYDIPTEVLSDETFAAMMDEAGKYLGYPYVWGGSSPATSFDCSGFVSWVINHSGWDVGRLGAQGLCNICTLVSQSNAKPGDLIFFTGTYNSGTPVSHVGIYVGDNKMIHCGDPIQFADLNSSYWQNHFYAYGRLPGND